MDDFDPVGIAEIAERLGVPANTVSMWRKRRRLPPADGTIGKAPWWHWTPVATWARENGYPHPKEPKKASQ